jgi:DNA repair protein RadC
VDPAGQREVFVRTAEDARRLLAPLFEGAQAERIGVLHLDGERRLLGIGQFEGGFDAVELPARALFVEALRLGAEGMVVSHNHPSGDADPSASDRRATRMLAETGERLGIALHDHLIFTAGECRSLRALGLL